MAIQFHELPPEAFPDSARPYIARLNRELRELFALEGEIRTPREVQRSDSTITRRGGLQVDVSRITPDISGVVSGSSTIIGPPNLTFSTTNAVGTTRTVVSVNSTVALFDTTVPAGVSNTAATGVAAFAARRDHRHDHPVFSTGDLHTDLLPLSGVRDMTGELGTDVGTFRSDVASGGTGFRFRTSNSFSTGTLWQVDDNGTVHHDISFEGHHRIADSASGVASQRALSVFRTISGDNRASFGAASFNATIGGVIAGIIYSPTLTGVECTASFSPTSFGTGGTRTVRGGAFTALADSTDPDTVAMVNGGRFTAQGSANQTGLVTDAIGAEFQVTGTFGGGLTNAYAVRTPALTSGTNRWGGNFGNRVAVTSPAADAQEVLSLTQSNTGATAGVHVKFNDKAGDPGSPVAGDLWRNGDSLNFRRSADTVDLAAAASGGDSFLEWAI